MRKSNTTLADEFDKKLFDLAGTAEYHAEDESIGRTERERWAIIARTLRSNRWSIRAMMTEKRRKETDQ